MMSVIKKNSYHYRRKIYLPFAYWLIEFGSAYIELAAYIFAAAAAAVCWCMAWFNMWFWSFKDNHYFFVSWFCSNHLVVLCPCPRKVVLWRELSIRRRKMSVVHFLFDLSRICLSVILSRVLDPVLICLWITFFAFQSKVRLVFTIILIISEFRPVIALSLLNRILISTYFFR